jgi:hypothetical protein
LGRGEVCRNANNASIFLTSRERAKVFCVVRYEYAFLVYRELVDIRVRKAAVLEVGCNVFDIKLTIEKEKDCPMGHVFIE